MAKQKAAAVTEDVDTDEARIIEVCGDLASAKEIAMKMFKLADAPPALVFEVYDRLVVGAETDEDKAQDLLRAREVAKELFGVADDAVVSSEMVFGVFDRIFEEDEEE